MWLDYGIKCVDASSHAAFLPYLRLQTAIFQRRSVQYTWLIRFLEVLRPSIRCGSIDTEFTFDLGFGYGAKVGVVQLADAVW